MKIDTLMGAADPKLIAEKSRGYEALGFDCVWTFEAKHDALIPLAYAAASTEKLEIGTNIAVAFARSPFSMAQVAWDLQKYSSGRFRLGLGTQVKQHVERRFSMPFDRPADRIIDYIRCVHSVWETFQTGQRPAYDGPFYKFKLINDFFNPGPLEHPSIPIYLAGVNPRMCEAAGEVADGFHVHPMHSPSYLQEVVVPSLEVGAQKGGRSVENIELYAPVFVITGESQDEIDYMENSVRRQIAFYGSTPSYLAVLEHHGYGDLGRRLNGLMREGNIAEMIKIIPEDLIDQLAVVEKPTNIGATLRKRYDGLLDRVSLYLAMDEEDRFTRWDQLIKTVHA